MIRRPGEEYTLDPRIQQPREVTVVASRLFVFVVPEQEEEAISSLYGEGAKIYLEAWRPRDKTASNVKIEFQVKFHNGPEDICSLCYEHPDR